MNIVFLFLSLEFSTPIEPCPPGEALHEGTFRMMKRRRSRGMTIGRPSSRKEQRRCERLKYLSSEASRALNCKHELIHFAERLVTRKHVQLALVSTLSYCGTMRMRCARRWRGTSKLVWQFAWQPYKATIAELWAFNKKLNEALIKIRRTMENEFWKALE